MLRAHKEDEESWNLGKRRLSTITLFLAELILRTFTCSGGRFGSWKHFCFDFIFYAPISAFFCIRIPALKFAMFLSILSIQAQRWNVLIAELSGIMSAKK